MKKSILIVIVLILLSGCSPKGDEPTFIDRSTGWNPSIAGSYLLDVSQYTPDDQVFSSFLFDGSSVNRELQPITLDINDDPSHIAECALRTAFGDSYRGIGRGKIVQTTLNNGILLFATKQTAVLIDGTNHQLIQCIDLRIQKQFRTGVFTDLRQGIVNVNVDLAKLTRDEILILRDTVAGKEPEGDELIYDNKELPLCAQTAYDATVKSVYDKYAGKTGGRLNAIGGAFYVYKSNASDSWIVWNDLICQILDRATGERLLLTGSSKDRSTKE
jgi:hypothetical protein